MEENDTSVVSVPEMEKTQVRYSFTELERFLEEYQRNNRNATKAAMIVRPWLANKPERARTVGSRMLKRIDQDQADMVLALRAVGVGAKKIAEKIMQLLDSKRIIKTYTKDGDVHIIEEDNINAIDKGLVHALKIGVGGGYKAEEIRQSGVVGHAHFSLGDLFEKAKIKELEIQSSMSEEQYQQRVKGLLEEAKRQYEE